MALLPKDRFSALFTTGLQVHQPSTGSALSVISKSLCQNCFVLLLVACKGRINMHFSRDNFPSFTSKTLNPKEGILFILEMLRNIDSDWHLYSSTGSGISEVQE